MSIALDKSSSERNASTNSKAAEIRSVAVRLFAKEGYQAVSMRQIAEHTGVQAGSIYNHVAGKQELLFEFIYELESNLHAVVSKAVDRAPAPTSALRAYIREFLKYATMNANLHVLATREVCCLDADQAEQIDRVRQASSDLLKMVLEYGNRRGFFEVENVGFAAAAIRTLLDGMVAVAAKRKGDYEATRKEIEKLILRYCKPRVEE